MQIQSVKLAYFSPTGTTESIVKAVARNIKQGSTELIDITPPDARRQPLIASENDLLMVAVPVYSGRLPVVLGKWLQAIEAGQTPAVCIVVYGNREYDDALLELKDIIKSRGGVPIACAAFIGEHSFSSADTPIAAARPDAADLRRAEEFGIKINEIMRSISSGDVVADIKVPGNHPYKDLTPLLPVTFMEVSDQCSQCGVCAQVCPVGAIDPENSSLLDVEKCIWCCACIKACPEDAMTMKAGPVKDIALRLNQMCKERKEPVFFF